MNKKIGVYVAHDDDAILGVGGIIIKHLKNKDDVYIVVCADGRNSHKAVLNIKKNPTPKEVKRARRKEIKNAIKILGLKEERLYLLNLPRKDGRIYQNENITKDKILMITKKEKPDIIYFHYPDAHLEHFYLNKIVIEIIKKLKKKPISYQFFIWTKELAKNRPEVKLKAPEIPKNAIKVDIKKFLKKKRKALFEMKSQVENWPYFDWQIQEKPILDKEFIDYFLRGEEILLKYNY